MTNLELNEVIHQPVRLQIMAALTSMEPGNEVRCSSAKTRRIGICQYK